MTQQVVRTVLGPVPANDLGRVLIHETLLSVFPGAELAPDVVMDKSKIFDRLKEKLQEFSRLGGKTIVDRSGMFHGRDPWLYQTLSKTTGVHIIASTGLGPEKMLSGYFTTPQSHPPMPWPAEKFAGLFTKEVLEGMVVPRVERAGFPGLVTSIANTNGLTEIEANLFRGCAQTAKETGVPVSVQYGTDAVSDLQVITNEGLSAERVIIGGLDREEAVVARAAFAIAETGAYVAIDHIGWGTDEGYVSDSERVKLITELLEAGHGERILLSTNAVGVAKGHVAKDLSFDYLFTTFIPLLRQAGVTEEQITLLLEENPQRILATDASATHTVANKEKAWNELFSPVLF
ncbi:MAG: phosphotriesterase [Solibacillus sp.]